MIRRTIATLVFCMTSAACAGAMDDSTTASEPVTGAANAADDNPADNSALQTVQSSEQLIGQPPAGWRRTGTTNIGNLRRAVYVPEDEPVDDSNEAWTRRITFESMQEDPLPDPIDFIELMNSDRDYACGTFHSYPTFSGLENGYPTSVHLLVCHKDRVTERAEVSMIKTIQGNEYFYVITRAWRGAPISGSRMANSRPTAMSGSAKPPPARPWAARIR